MTRPFEGERHHNATSFVRMQIMLFKRGAVVKAMAICTPHPFIQIFMVRLLSCMPDDG
jgi:hypothetical protein